MSHSIVHITDFHLTEQEEYTDLLREGYYEEYFTGFINECTDMVDPDSLVITGDLVEEGQFEHYERAEEIIKYVSSGLGLSPQEDVILCPGNHDIDLTEDELGNLLEARKEFYSVASNFKNRKPEDEAKRSQLYQLDDSLSCLALDSTLGAGGDDQPGAMSQDSADEVITKIKENVSDDDTLLILSHHPIDIFPGSPIVREESRFADRHFWHDGRRISERLRNPLVRKGMDTIWFSGDIHLSDQMTIDGYLSYVTTGRVGTKKEKVEEDNYGVDSLVPRQGKIIEIEESTLSTYLVNAQEVGHQGASFIDGWYVNKRSPKSVDSSSQGLGSTDGESTPTKQSPESIQEEYVKTTPSVLDEELENKIYESIQSDNLYSVGSFRVNKRTVSLGWIWVNKLLNDRGIFSDIVSVLSSWVSDSISTSGLSVSDSVLLVGSDCWGSIISSFIAVKLDCQNICVAARGRGDYSADSEKPSEALSSVNLEGISHIVIMTDVTVTGRTIEFLYGEISSSSDIEPGVEYFASSILSCHSNNKYTGLEFLTSFSSCCNRISIPNIASADLPSDDIIVPDIDIT